MNEPDRVLMSIDFAINMLLRAKEMMEDGNTAGAGFVIRELAVPEVYRLAEDAGECLGEVVE